MTSYPQLHALLGELCDLEAEDERLPLQVLINLHRGLLRAPLEQLVHLGEPSAHAREVFGNHNAIMQAVATYFELGWPGLNIDLYTKQPGLIDIVARIEDRFSTLSDGTMLDAAGEPGSDVVDVIYGCFADFRPYDPIYLLHHLTWRGAEINLVAQVLEMELGVSPQVREAILHLAGKTTAAVSA